MSSTVFPDVLFSSLFFAASFYYGRHVPEIIKEGPGFRYYERGIRKPFRWPPVLKHTIPFALMIPCCALMVIDVVVYIQHSRQIDVHLYLKYFFGFTMNMVFNTFVKMCVVKNRPHFLDVHGVTSEEAELKGNGLNGHRWRREEELPSCNSRRSWLIKEARKSFFSGHSCMGMFGGVFVALHLNQVVERSFPRLILQLTSLLAGSVLGILQYRSYWHFGVDILVGYMWAGAYAFLSYLVLYT